MTGELGGGAAGLVLALYLLLLALAAASDVLRFLIPNVLPAGLIGLFLLAGLTVPERVDWPSHLGAAGLALLGGSVLFHFERWGGGDVKLLGAAALWAGLSALPGLLVATALAGGALAILLLVLRALAEAWIAGRPPGLAGAPGAPVPPRILRPGAGVPYGLAIAIGGALTVPEIPLFF